MKRPEQEIQELREAVAQLKREVLSLRKEVRPAAPLAARNGRYVGKTNADVGFDGDVDVTVWTYEVTGGVGWDETLIVIEDVEPIGMQEGQVLPAGTDVFVFWYETKWVLLPMAVGTTVVRFELTETLTLSGHAAAKLKKPTAIGTGAWEDTNPVVAIEVYDPYNTEGMWNGISGYQGWAIPRAQDYTTPNPDRPAYDIVWMERIAQQIRGTTNEYIGASVAGRVAVVVDWYDHQGKNPGGTVNCFDPNNLFPATFSGAEVLAEYNNRDGRYELIQAQQVARFATAQFNGACCGADPATIDTFSVIAQSLDIGAPGTTPTTATNPRAHAGLDNDPILLMRVSNTPNTPTWTIVDAKKYLRRPITTVEISGGVLQYKTKDIYVEVCDTAESSPTTIANTTECP